MRFEDFDGIGTRIASMEQINSYIATPNGGRFCNAEWSIVAATRPLNESGQIEL
jgi:hypothetical protein